MIKCTSVFLCILALLPFSCQAIKLSFPDSAAVSNQAHWSEVNAHIETMNTTPDQITHVSLNQRNLRVIPSWVFEKTRHITRLSITGTNIKEVPEKISSLPNLEHLAVPQNKIKTVHPNIVQLTKLKVLNLNDNALSVLPTFLFRIPSLKMLKLARNQLHSLQGIPGDQAVTNLQRLTLAKNNLHDLPQNIDRLSALEHLDLSQNAFVLLPQNIAKLKAHLHILDLRDNPLGAKDEGDAIGRTTLQRLFGDKLRL